MPAVLTLQLRTSRSLIDVCRNQIQGESLAGRRDAGLEVVGRLIVLTDASSTKTGKQK